MEQRRENINQRRNKPVIVLQATGAHVFSGLDIEKVAIGPGHALKDMLARIVLECQMHRSWQVVLAVKVSRKPVSPVFHKLFISMIRQSPYRVCMATITLGRLCVWHANGRIDSWILIGLDMHINEEVTGMYMMNLKNVEAVLKRVFS